MIISPSVSQVLRGVIHELGTSLKDGLTDPVKLGQIDAIIGVLGSCAVRCDYQSGWIVQESEAIVTLAKKYESAMGGTSALTQLLSGFEGQADDAARYQNASEMLCVMGDQGAAVGAPLYSELSKLMAQRLENEMHVIGGGFEAAGR